jgi:type IV secretory pathway TraG/TraD family ATPase VirD4
MMMQHFNETEREFDKKKTLLVIDEAAAIFRNRDQPTEMAQQFRSKQIALCFGFQEKSGLEKGDKIGLLDTLINNSTTYFISRLKDESTLKAVAAIHGTKKHVMPTMQTTYGPDGTRIQGEAESLRIDETMV